MVRASLSPVCVTNQRSASSCSPSVSGQSSQTRLPFFSLCLSLFFSPPLVFLSSFAQETRRCSGEVLFFCDAAWFVPCSEVAFNRVRRYEDDYSNRKSGDFALGFFLLVFLCCFFLTSHRAGVHEKGAFSRRRSCFPASPHLLHLNLSSSLLVCVIVILTQLTLLMCFLTAQPHGQTWELCEAPAEHKHNSLLLFAFFEGGACFPGKAKWDFSWMEGFLGGFPGFVCIVPYCCQLD